MHSHKVGNWSFRIFINDVKAREIMKGIGFWDPDTRVYDDNIDHSAVSTLKIAGVLERCGINSGFTRWLTWLDVICPDEMNHEKSGGLIARTLYASKRMWKLRVAFHGFMFFFLGPEWPSVPCDIHVDSCWLHWESDVYPTMAALWHSMSIFDSIRHLPNLWMLHPHASTTDHCKCM